MSTTQDQVSEDNNEKFKTRASKACARCRFKKARCSGGIPCTNCKLADAVCHFGNFKRSQRKMFPEQAMEAQQHKLEAAVHTMYYRLLAANAWPGPRLTERDGNPLIHDILAVLGLLESVNDEKSQFERERLELGETQPYSPNGDGSIVEESPKEQYQERRNSAPTQSQGPPAAFHSRDHSNQSLSLVPEARWFGGIPGLLSKSVTSAHSLIVPRRLDFAAASSSSTSRTPTANNQQQTQSLPASFAHQQIFMVGESSQSATHHPPSFEAVDRDFSDGSTAWWYADQHDSAEQQIPVAAEGPGYLNGPCELDGLWQSSEDRGVPQVSPEEDNEMDRELATHFFKVGW